MDKPGWQKLKLACVVCIVTKQVLSIIRLIEVIAQNESIYYFEAALALYIPDLVVGTVFSPIQLYSLLRELQQDILWNKFWFCRIFTLYTLTYWLYLYEFGIFRMMLYLFGLLHNPSGYFFDSADVVLNLVTQALMLKILCRSSSSTDDQIVAFQQPASSSSAVTYAQTSAHGQLATHSQAVMYSQPVLSNQQTTLSAYQTGANIPNAGGNVYIVINLQSTETCCNKSIAFAFGVIFWIIYLFVVIGLFLCMAFPVDIK